MIVPDWRTSKAGARVRVALWLLSEIGLGGIFTKAQLREAFPGVEQVDRRMRDLRREGWVIATYREDRSLAADELRLIKLGGEVWERRYQSRVGDSTTDKQRRAVFAGDNYACVYCGIGAGETYVDSPLRTAKLSVTHVSSAGADGSELLTACDRCRAAPPDVPATDLIVSQVARLDAVDLQRLASWISHGRRSIEPAERIWSLYRRLPRASRDLVAKAVRQR